MRVQQTLSPWTSAGLGILCWASCFVAPAARSEDAGDDEIRPFDKVYLKISRDQPLVGTITAGVWDPSSPMDIEIRTTSGVVTRILADQIGDVVPRQTAEEVYRKKLKAVQAERDPGRRAAAELALGIWSKSPQAVLSGNAPRPSSAQAHIFNALELNPALSEAYPHLISLLDAAKSPGAADAADTAGVLEVVRAALLAARGKQGDPELEFRLGVLLATRLGLPERARPYLEKVLASGYQNLAQLREARTLLRDIYVARGDAARAIAMYEMTIAPQESAPANFEPFYELARLHARTGTADGDRVAREFYAKAQALQPGYAPIVRELAALDYRQGDFASAEKRLKALTDKDRSDVAAAIDLALVRRRLGQGAQAEKAIVEQLAGKAEGLDAARWHQAKGVFLEDRGDFQGAAAEYRKAVEIDPESAELKLFLAFALVRTGQAAEARAMADQILTSAGDSRWLFAAVSRLRAEADIQEGRVDPAIEQMLRAVEIDQKDALLLERAGILLERKGDQVAGYELLRRAVQLAGDRPYTLIALAYHHHARGELDAARKLFDRVLELVPAPKRPAEGPPPPVPIPRTYALQGRQLIDDLERLEVWTADFTGPDAASIGGWQETERFGVDISRKGSVVVLAGKQAGEAEGITSAMLERPVEANSFDRIAMRARVDSGKVRVGLRLEGRSSRGTSAAGLVLYKDIDGVLKIQVKSSRGEWQPVNPTEETSPDRGRLVYHGKVRWPEDTASHSLEIRRTRAASSTQLSRTGAFDLLLDGENVAWNVRVEGLSGLQYEVGFSAQTDAVGNEFSATVESFRIYRERPRTQKTSQQR